MLAERTEEHHLYFEEDREAVFFSDIDEATDKIKYYAANDSARRTIAEAGYRRCTTSGYRYIDRAGAVLKILDDMMGERTPAFDRSRQGPQTR